jgi:23S rRNA (adenine2030-N6)-methyltransferase
MFSYRHTFHAGNHADVLKHMILVHLIRHFQQKDKGVLIVDTHAGAAVHDLDSRFAQKNAEYESGVGRLWPLKVLPGALEDYRNQVRAANPSPQTLAIYPGSAQIAYQLLRPQDRLRMYELHTTEGRLLEQHFREAEPRAIAQQADGFERLRSQLPPPTRRGLVLMDPPYEDKADYQRVIATLRDAFERFATGTYALWYPIVRRRESHDLPERLKRLAKDDWLNVTLTVSAPPEDGHGLYGSGMFIFNPPWTLPGMLRECMPFLSETLRQDDNAGYSLDSRIA